VENPFNNNEMAAYWTAMIRDGVNPFREFVCDPALFNRLDAWPRPSSILDVACGEGYLARRLAAQGHHLTALDLSFPLLQAARQANQAGESYLCGDVFRLPFAAASFDCAVSNFLLIELANPAAAITEICRVLKPGGRFLFQIVHPFSFTANDGSTGRRRIANYFTGQRFEEKFIINGQESPLPSIRYHHPLSTYTQALSRSNCHITALEEPRPIPTTPPNHPIRQTLQDPWFLLIEAQKPDPEKHDTQHRNT
jgi:SAM-dependent methyltransferase